jgi:hypothetical protein
MAVDRQPETAGKDAIEMESRVSGPGVIANAAVLGI